MFRGFSRALAILMVSGVVGVGGWVVSTNLGAYHQDAEGFGAMVASIVGLTLCFVPVPRDEQDCDD